MNNKLSIITINYNNLEGLKKTFESVFNQTFKDFEYVVIDGGSTDGSAALIEQHQDKIDYWVSEKDKGIYNAMNKGVQKATGVYLQFLNSGDTLVDNEILAKVFEEPRTEAIIYGDLNLVLPNNETKLLVSLQENELSLANFNSNTKATISHPSSFILRDLFDGSLYDEKYDIIADIKFFIDKIILQNCTVKYLPYVISCFNLEGVSSNPANWDKTIAERDQIFSEFLPPRILKDYKVYFQVKDSQLLEYLPYLENTNGLKKLIVKMVGLLISVHKFIKPSKK